MKNYRIKKLIPGGKVDPEFKDLLLIAVPEAKIMLGVKVLHKGGEMVLSDKSEPLKKIKFLDKYGRGEYTLWYFEWKPAIDQINILGNFDILKNVKRQVFSG